MEIVSSIKSEKAMAGDRVRVYITVDTETSMGGAWKNREYAPLPLDRPVLGKCGDRFLGIPLIMDILESFGFRATFFTEVFCAYAVGDKPLAGVFDLILKRGHDPQLHLHPTYRFYRDYLSGQPRRGTDLMFQLPEEEQRQLIGEGIELFRRLTGKKPRAYRAGCYGASESTLRALRANDVEMDSSYNLSYLGQTCGFEAASINGPVVLEDIQEFPVTVFQVSGLKGYKPLEISAVSVAEMITSIRLLQDQGCRDVVLVLHSFSLMKNCGLRFDSCQPDNIVIRRLRRLCAALAQRQDQIEVRVLGEAPPAPEAQSAVQYIPTLGWLQPSFRKLVQGVNRLSWV